MYNLLGIHTPPGVTPSWWDLTSHQETSMANMKRLSTDEIGILLDALDTYALMEDPDRSKDEDEAIAALAATLVGDDSDPAVEDVIVLWTEECASNAALPDVGSPVAAVAEEDLDGDEVDDEADLDDEDGEELSLEA